MTGRKFVPSIKNTVREICIIRRAKENILVGTMESWSLSNLKRDVSVCECSGNNIKLSQCQRDISRHVQAYGLSINRDEISDEMDLILCRAGK